MTSYYSPDYFTARRRFAAACARVGIAHQSLPVEAPSPNAERLSIDVAVAGDENPTSAVVLSSGMHGVEGFFGSAVQLAVLDRLAPGWRPPKGAALIFLHALNPFGFAWQRRFNEDNVDLNRNFMLPGQEYAGAPPLCETFRRALMPAGRLARLELWQARMALLAWRHGVRSFWETLPVGQYEYPDWLFFGGRAPSQTAIILERLLPALLGGAEEVVHLDFHTGLGRWADQQLLLPDAQGSDQHAWWMKHFGPTKGVKATHSAGAYEIRGGLGMWLAARFPACRYRFATAEFGTYSPLRVIRALLEELRWHTRLGGKAGEHWSRRQLTETFVPRSRAWRHKCVERGISLVASALKVSERAAEAQL